MKYTRTLLAALLLAPFAALNAATPPAKPSIVVIVADDLGYADVLFNPLHPKEVTTPHLDSLVYLAFNAVHAPLQAPAEEIAKFNTGTQERNTLLAMGKRLDDAIGRVVATLKRENLWSNTLLFFCGDNGGPLAQTADNSPLRGGKHQDYEGGIRVPFLVCWPARLKPGETPAPVIALDILPTALAGCRADAATCGGHNR